MIVQYTKNVAQWKTSGVIRAISCGSVQGIGQILVIGTQNRELIILDNDLEILQVIPFSQWVRSISVADLTGNGNPEIITGSGDKFLRIFTYQEHEFLEQCSYEFEHFVTSCSIADIDGDGILEIAVGSWDKTVKLLRYEEGTCLDTVWESKFDQRIQKVIIDDITWNGEKNIIVLFKKTGLAILDGKTGEILQQKTKIPGLLCGTVGPLEKSGYPLLVVGGNDKQLYFYDHTGMIIHKLPMGVRITSLLIADIDGDGQNELIVGEGNKNLAVYKVEQISLNSLQPKWKHRIHNVITDIELCDINEDQQREIIFGGYDRSLHILKDHYYGAPAYFSMDTPSFFRSKTYLGVSLESSKETDESSLSTEISDDRL